MNDLEIGDHIELQHGPFVSTWRVVEVIDPGARLTYCGDVRFVGHPGRTAFLHAPGGGFLTTDPEQEFLGRAHWPAAKRVGAPPVLQGRAP